MESYSCYFPIYLKACASAQYGPILTTLDTGGGLPGISVLSSLFIFHVHSMFPVLAVLLEAYLVPLFSENYS